MGPLTSPNLNIAAIWVRDPWVSIQINFWGSIPPAGEVPAYMENNLLFLIGMIYFGSFFCPGSTHISEFEYRGNMG